MILSLCDQTHTWGAPYAATGELVLYFDLAHGQDVRDLEHIRGKIRGIIMQPPCTEFAVSGARWWSSKGHEKLLQGLAIVDACLRQVAIHNPDFWVLENPVGRLGTYLGPPAYTYNPTEYGDPWNKRTCLWGVFTMPQPYVNHPIGDDRIHKMAPGPDRALKRAVTPPGFSRAFQEYNP